jgi:hypothetical protein
LEKLRVTLECLTRREFLQTQRPRSDFTDGLLISDFVLDSIEQHDRVFCMQDKIHRIEWIEIQRELEELYRHHEETSTNSAKCREFNRLSAAFLQKLEDIGCDRIADLFMGLLGGCSPKDFSHCDNHELTKGTLERIRARVKESLEQSQE